MDPDRGETDVPSPLTREDVVCEVERLFDPAQRAEVIEALDVYQSTDESERARVQLAILHRTGPELAAIRALVHHLTEPDVEPPRTPAEAKNEHYAG